MKFSERAGLTPVSSVVQTGAISTSLRNSLWNVLHEHVFGAPGFASSLTARGPEPPIQRFSKQLWSDYFKLAVDSRPNEGYKILQHIRDYFFKSEWYKVYDFIEFVIAYNGSQALRDDLNHILTRELSGYRLISGQVVEITDPRRWHSSRKF